MNKLQEASLLQAWDMFSPFVPPAVLQKFHRIIQLQEGNKQREAFCPSGSLSMDLLDVTYFFGKSYSNQENSPTDQVTCLGCIKFSGGDLGL